MIEMRFKTNAMNMAYEAENAPAFATAALAFCAPSMTRSGASTNRINVKPGLQVQVELLTQFVEMDGGDMLRDGAANSRSVQDARTMTWSWSDLVMTKPSSSEAIYRAVLHPQQAGDGVYRTENGYVVRAAGINSLHFGLEEFADLQYKDGGAFLAWLADLELEELP